MKFKDNEVSVHTSKDDTDPGFMLKGFKLRWVSGAVESRRAGRIWAPLKVSALPDIAGKRLKDSNPSWFSAGDTIRRGDLVLCFAPLDKVEALRNGMREQQRINEGVFRRGAQVPGNIPGARTIPDDTGIERMEIGASEKFG